MTRNRIKEFREVRASALISNPANFRLHPKSQRQAMEGILREVGNVDVLKVVETPEGLKLIDGHLRTDIMGDEVVQVAVLDIDEEEAKKVLLMFDHVGSMAEADTEVLDGLMQSIEFEEANLTAIMGEWREDVGLAVEDEPKEEGEVEPPPVSPVSRPGDLWQIGPHLVLCGDSTDADDVARVTHRQTPAIMVTDPPYGVSYDPAWRRQIWDQVGDVKRVGQVDNDDRAGWTDAYRLFAGNVAYVWHSALHSLEFGANLVEAGFDLRSQIIWAKPSLLISRGHYHWQHEPCFYAVRKGATAGWCGDRKQSTLWEIANAGCFGSGTDDDESTNHGTQKPLECMQRPIRLHGQAGDHVYDPFLGSGTTLVAAEREGRVCVGIDIDPIYVDVAVARAAKYLGVEPVLEGKGLTFAQVMEERLG